MDIDLGCHRLTCAPAYTPHVPNALLCCWPLSLVPRCCVLCHSEHGVQVFLWCADLQHGLSGSHVKANFSFRRCLHADLWGGRTSFQSHGQCVESFPSAPTLTPIRCFLCDCHSDWRGMHSKCRFRWGWIFVSLFVFHLLRPISLAPLVLSYSYSCLAFLVFAIVSILASSDICKQQRISFILCAVPSCSWWFPLRSRSISASWGPIYQLSALSSDRLQSCSGSPLPCLNLGVRSCLGDPEFWLLSECLWSIWSWFCME